MNSFTHQHNAVKILAIGDTANVVSTLRKFIKRTTIDFITFKDSTFDKISVTDTNTRFFKSNKIQGQLKQLSEIKKDYDFFLVANWTAAKLAYMLGMEYIFIFNGDDIRHPPFKKDATFNYHFNFLERIFYKNVFDNVNTYVANHPEIYDLLKIYTQPTYINHLVDFEMFKPSIVPAKIDKNKFTFFSPQRISYDKGTDIVWKAIEKCKSDFEVLQVNWFDTFPHDSVKKSKSLLLSKPSKVRLVPLIEINKMANYYVAADAILGQVSPWGIISNVEREAAACMKPVIAYVNPKYEIVLNNESVPIPFLPKKRDPDELAEIIDKVVTSKDFKDNLAINGFKFINKTSNPVTQADEYDRLFEIRKYELQNKSRRSYTVLRKLLFFMGYYTNFRRLISKIT